MTDPCSDLDPQFKKTMSKRAKAESALTMLKDLGYLKHIRAVVKNGHQ